MGATDSIDKKKRTLLPLDRHGYPVLCNKVRIDYADVISTADSNLKNSNILLKHHPV